VLAARHTIAQLRQPRSEGKRKKPCRKTETPGDSQSPVSDV
jgi:hypothetical protein